MAVKRLGIFIIAAALIAGAAVWRYSLLKQRERRRAEDAVFVHTYIGLAMAREIYADSPDSLENSIESIYSRNGVDSVWMVNHLSNIGSDAQRRLDIWNGIVDALDSLKRERTGDIPRPVQSGSAVNADST